MVNPTSTMWTAEDVAEFLCISRQTIYRWRVEGVGPPAYKIGGQLRYSPDDVRRWAETQRDVARGR